jgi:hypothetical protein
MERPFRVAFNGRTTIASRIRMRVETAREFTGSEIPEPLLSELPALLGGGPDENGPRDVGMVREIAALLRSSGEGVEFPYGFNENALTVLPQRMCSTILWHSLPPRPERVTDRMRRYLLTQPVWVSHYVLGENPPTLLLPPEHLTVLHAILTQLASFADDRPPDDWMVLALKFFDRPSMCDALMSILEARAWPSSAWATGINEFVTALASILGGSLRVALERMASTFPRENNVHLWRYLFFLTDLSVSPDFRLPFRELVASQLTKVVGSATVRLPDCFIPVCQLVAKLEGRKAQEGLQLVRLMLLLNAGGRRCSALAAVAKLPPDKREALQRTVEFAFTHMIVDDVDISLPTLPSIINAFPSLAGAHQKSLVILLSKCFTEFTADRLPLIGALLARLLPPRQTGSVPSARGAFFSALRIPQAIFAQAPEVWEVIAQHAELIRRLIAQNHAIIGREFRFLLMYPELLDTKDKHEYFLQRQRGRLLRHQPVNLRVRREHILNDSFLRLQNLPPERFLGRMHVTFTGEAGIDAGGLTKAWFEEVTHAIFSGNFGLFETTPNRRCSQPLPASSELNENHCRYFTFAGRIVARAMIEGIPVQAHMTTAFLKQILGRQPSLRDVEEIDPLAYRSLLWIAENPLGDQELYFTAGVDEITNREIELCPDGSTRQVTEENKAEYVTRMVQSMLHDRIASQVRAFQDGFYSLVPIDDIRLFEPSELDLVICGLPEISLDDFRRNCRFVAPYHSEHPVIAQFFEVLASWDMERRGRLLFFMTASSHVPLGGFKALRDARVPLTIQPGGPGDRLPTAHTCSNTLDLPLYTTRAEMEAKLFLAIYGTESFELI